MTGLPEAVIVRWTALEAFYPLGSLRGTMAGKFGWSQGEQPYGFSP